MMTEQAKFVQRDRCIGCRSDRLETVAEGRYQNDPLHGFLSNDPWGVSPLSHLSEARWKLVQCAACGTRFHGTILDTEWRMRCLTEWMSGDAIDTFNQAHGADGFAPRLARGSAWVGHVLSIETMTRDRGERAPRLLDFGCGAGEFLSHAAAFGFEAWGIDASVSRREVAGRTPVTIVSSLDELPRERAGMLDAITLFEVLEHLDDPRAVLEALRRWIRPGGILVLETPDAGHVDRITTIDEYRAVHPLDHINAFSATTLAAIAERSGFMPVRRHFAFTSTSAGQSLRKEARRIRDSFRKPQTQLYFRAA